MNEILGVHILGMVKDNKLTSKRIDKLKKKEKENVGYGLCQTLKRKGKESSFCLPAFISLGCEVLVGILFQCEDLS